MWTRNCIPHGLSPRRPWFGHNPFISHPLCEIELCGKRAKVSTCLGASKCRDNQVPISHDLRAIRGPSVQKYPKWYSMTQYSIERQVCQRAGAEQCSDRKKLYARQTFNHMGAKRQLVQKSAIWVSKGLCPPMCQTWG